MKRTSQLKICQAQASVTEDRDMIFRLVEHSPGFSELNRPLAKTWCGHVIEETGDTSFPWVNHDALFGWSMLELCLPRRWLTNPDPGGGDFGIAHKKNMQMFVVPASFGLPLLFC